jgi:hypothetical protein
MRTIPEIQEAIARLNETEREELRLWLETYEEDDWDRQITADAASGKLDFLKKQAQTAKNNWKTFCDAHPPVMMGGPANLSSREGFAP